MTTLNDIHKAGGIELLHSRGLVSSSILLYFKYYECYLKYRVQHKKTYRESIILTAIEHKISESTIRRAVKKIRD